jgi:hypothetical protein
MFAHMALDGPDQVVRTYPKGISHRPILDAKSAAIILAMTKSLRRRHCCPLLTIPRSSSWARKLLLNLHGIIGPQPSHLQTRPLSQSGASHPLPHTYLLYLHPQPTANSQQPDTASCIALCPAQLRGKPPCRCRAEYNAEPYLRTPKYPRNWEIRSILG